MSQQSGRTTLQSAIKYVRRFIREPALLLQDADINENWKFDFVAAFARHIHRPSQLKEELLNYIAFLEDSWTNRKEGKRWTPTVPPEEWFPERAEGPGRKGKWKPIFAEWVKAAKDGEYASLEEMRRLWVLTYSDEDKYAVQTFNRLVRENSEIKTIFAEAPQRGRGRPKKH
jgi:hypothetical protein